jgi:hypothetical protein
MMDKLTSLLKGEFMLVGTQLFEVYFECQTRWM